MICESCSGLVLWNEALTETKCMKCGAVNNHILEADDYEVRGDADYSIECPECHKLFDQRESCECGYEHSCGGRSEACMIPGCLECNPPNTSLDRPQRPITETGCDRQTGEGEGK